MNNAIICSQENKRKINARSGLSVVSGSLIYLVNSVSKEWQRWRRNSRTRRHLAAMDSDMLKDVGISRSDRVNEVNKPFWKD